MGTLENWKGERSVGGRRCGAPVGVGGVDGNGDGVLGGQSFGPCEPSLYPSPPPPYPPPTPPPPPRNFLYSFSYIRFLSYATPRTSLFFFTEGQGAIYVSHREPTAYLQGLGSEFPLFVFPGPSGKTNIKNE